MQGEDYNRTINIGRPAIPHPAGDWAMCPVSSQAGGQATQRLHVGRQIIKRRLVNR